ncbi:MAG TPA: acyl-CoA dehydrogenase family protein [Acidimicrobiales bacterium]|jgi:alkylation response protein AidB-like acyl-CoA dehydrogenase|nr:acyl-CoA dehydrogenase family protein [Acidimicrobiales bacterium]
MDLDLTEEQELLRDTVRGLCARHAGLDVVRSLEDDPIGYADKLWAELGESGVLGLTIPDGDGGSGMTLLDAAVVFLELGRALSPLPLFQSVVMAGGVLSRAGTDAQRSTLLPRIASGDAIVVPAWLEPDRGFGERGVALRASRDGDGWTLTGVKRHVQFARAAEQLLVLARADDGVVMFLVPTDAPGVTLTQQHTIASDAQYRVDFENVVVGDDARVGAADWSTWHDTMLDGIVLLAAQAAGGARVALDLTVQYAKDRKQFDKPLGAFQAIAHYLSDAVATVDGAETLVYEAAWAASTGRSVSRLAPMAKLFACQTFRDVTAVAQQVFGGVGFTVEYDIQLYFRRAKQLQISWWDTRYLEELVAADVLDGPAPPKVRE